MEGRDPYNELVRAHFENPVHAGDLEGDYPQVLSADVSESEQGARIVLSAGIDAGMIAEIRFRAWGCPHLIAAAEQLCRGCENTAVVALEGFSANHVMTELSVPPEKTGKILLLEDALRSLARQNAGNQ